MIDCLGSPLSRVSADGVDPVIQTRSGRVFQVLTIQIVHQAARGASGHYADRRGLSNPNRRVRVIQVLTIQTSRQGARGKAPSQGVRTELRLKKYIMFLLYISHINL